MMVPPPRVKPKLRGVFHEFGFYASIAFGLPLVLTADPGRAQVAAIVFSSCLAGCFGASALYHRPMWTPRVRSWLARLDHAGTRPHGRSADDDGDGQRASRLARHLRGDWHRRRATGPDVDDPTTF